MSLSKVEGEVLEVPAPTASFVRVAVTSHQVNAIPASLIGKLVRFHADGIAIYILFGAADTVQAVIAQASGGAAPVLTAHANSAIKIEAGTYQDFRIPAAGVSHFSHISTATTGYLRVSDVTGVV